MDNLSSVQQSPDDMSGFAFTPSEESLVIDTRDRLSSHEVIERKLIAALKNTPLPVSYLAQGRRVGQGR